MANSALINDLRKQFAENPRRVFARLANEYRKQGELEAAIEICRQHVPLQPTYISGYIVLGQALYESGQLDEARTTFETALELDPENLIALRQLGDIAHAHGDLDGARAWYQRLLEVDPQNDEVAEQLRAIEANAAQPDAEAAASSGPVSWSDINPEREEPQPAIEPVPTLSHFEMLVEPSTLAELVPNDPAALPAESPHVTAGDVAEPGLLELDDLVEIPLPPPPVAEPEPIDDLPVIAELAPAMEEPSPVEGLSLVEESVDVGEIPKVEGLVMEEEFAPPAELRPVEELTPGPEFTPVAESAPAAEHRLPEESPSIEALSPVDASAEDDEPSPPVFATETMAELYERQGFPERALSIYQQLAEHRPDDEALRERIARLKRIATPTGGVETVKAGRTAREFFGALAHRRPPRNGTADSNGARRSVARPATPTRSLGGGGLSSLFSDGAVAEHDDEAAVALAGAYAPGVLGKAGAPAAPAPDELSLDKVFGGGSEPEARRPEANVSFDEFFARDEGQAHGGNGAPQPSSGNEASDGDDLALFHDWLEGLKKS
jgi:tetratricopeptide (TPR) repeat protein